MLFVTNESPYWGDVMWLLAPGFRTLIWKRTFVSSMITNNLNLNHILSPVIWLYNSKHVHSGYHTTWVWANTGHLSSANVSTSKLNAKTSCNSLIWPKVGEPKSYLFIYFLIIYPNCEFTFNIKPEEKCNAPWSHQCQAFIFSKKPQDHELFFVFFNSGLWNLIN